MYMRFHWLRDRKAQGQFRIHWQPGSTNLADYFMKHHVRAEFLKRVKDLAEARSTKNVSQTTNSNHKITMLQGWVDKLAYES